MRFRRLVGLVFLETFICVHGWAARVPRLTVIVIERQLCADYIPRFTADFSSNGFQRLSREGIYFSSATETASEHALMANQWLKGKSLSQRLHAVYPKGRLYGVAYQSRLALLLGGPDQGNSFWWDEKNKRYQAFGSEPQWLKEGRNQFPRPGKGAENVDASIAAVALALAQAEHLGENSSGAPDVLAIGFSELEDVVHVHGPNAPETRMAVVRLDQQLGMLMTALESRISPHDMLWVITANDQEVPLLIWGDHLKPYTDHAVIFSGRVAPTILRALQIPAADLQPPLELHRHE